MRNPFSAMRLSRRASRFLSAGLVLSIVAMGVGHWSITSAFTLDPSRTGPAVYGDTEPPGTALPPAPVIVSVEPADRSVRVKWVHPDVDPTKISHFQAKVQPGSQLCLVKSVNECVINGLANGQPYVVTVMALGAGGWSRPSIPSAPVVPGKAGESSGEPPASDVPDSQTGSVLVTIGARSPGSALTRLPARPSGSMTRAPKLVLAAGTDHVIVLRGLRPRSLVLLDYRDETGWQKLARTRASRSGAATLKFIRVEGAGSLMMRVKNGKKRTLFFTLEVTPESGPTSSRMGIG